MAGAKGAAGSKGVRGAVGATSRPSSTRVAAPPINDKKRGKFEERDLPNWRDSKFRGKLDDLKDLGDEITELTAKMKGLEEEVKAKKVVARAIMEDVDDSESWSVRDEAWTAAYVKPEPRESLVREKLIEQGITLKQLEKATKRTEVQPYVTFRAKKQYDEGEED